MMEFVAFKHHEIHQNMGHDESDICSYCSARRETGAQEHEMRKLFIANAKEYYFRLEAEKLKSIKNAPQKKTGITPPWGNYGQYFQHYHKNFRYGDT